MLWEKMTTAQIGAADRDVPVVMNIAAVEQHGPHLPLDTDAAIGAHFLSRLEARDPEAQLVLPQVKVCASAHHLDFPGTLSVPHRVLMDYVGGILDSVRAAGFRTMLLLNSHGGNEAVGQVIVEDRGSRFPDERIAMATWWVLVRDALRGVTETGRFGTGHACEFETSLMMATGAIDEGAPLPSGVHHNPSYDWADGSMLHGSGATLYRSMREISGGSGVVGRPDKASRDKGERITAIVVDHLAGLIADLRGRRASR